MFKHIHKWRNLSPIELMVLLQLKLHPMHGYEIIKELKRKFEGLWEPKTGSVYPALRRLEVKGLVKTILKNGREIYYVTELGEEFLSSFISRLEKGLKFTNKYWEFILESLSFLGEEKQLEILKKLRQSLQSRLEVLDSKIKKLENKQIRGEEN